MEKIMVYTGIATHPFQAAKTFNPSVEKLVNSIQFLAFSNP
jgi:hypothetical protein